MKVIDDTLKKANGKFDKQALTFFVTFFITCAMGILGFAFSYIFGIQKNEMAMSILDSFMMLTFALSGTNIGNKIADNYVSKKTNTTGTEQEIPQE